MTVHEKTRYKPEIAILDNAQVKTLCYFMLKSDWPNGKTDWPNGDKITSVWDNTVLFSAIDSPFFFLYLSVLLKPNFLKKWKNTWFSHDKVHNKKWNCGFTITPPNPPTPSRPFRSDTVQRVQCPVNTKTVNTLLTSTTETCSFVRMTEKGYCKLHHRACNQAIFSSAGKERVSIENCSLYWRVAPRFCNELPAWLCLRCGYSAR